MNTNEYFPQELLPLPIPREWVEERTREWTDEAILALRDYLLIDALQSAIDRRCSPQTREEMKEWIFSDEVHPFCFSICASECGYDPEALRSVFARVLKRVEAGDDEAIQKVLMAHTTSGLFLEGGVHAEAA